MASTVSPGATVIAVPPSQLQLPFGVGLRTTEREASGAPAAIARAWGGPCKAALVRHWRRLRSRRPALHPTHRRPLGDRPGCVRSHGRRERALVETGRIAA